MTCKHGKQFEDLDIYSHALPGLYNEATDIIEALVSGQKTGAQVK